LAFLKQYEASTVGIQTTFAPVRIADTTLRGLIPPAVSFKATAPKISVEGLIFVESTAFEAVEAK
jgi:hypothetical protein